MRVKDQRPVSSPRPDWVPLGHAVRWIPYRPNYSTLFRWSTTGSKGIVLRTQRVGSRRFTTRAWVEEFLAACNEYVVPSAREADQELASEGL